MAAVPGHSLGRPGEGGAGTGGLDEDPAVLLVDVIARDLGVRDSEGLAAVVELDVGGVEGAAGGDVRDVGDDDRSEAHPSGLPTCWCAPPRWAAWHTAAPSTPVLGWTMPIE